MYTAHSNESTFWATTGLFPQEIIIKLGTAVSVTKIKTVTTNGTGSPRHTAAVVTLPHLTMCAALCYAVAGAYGAQ